jgi:hypothetical protein
MRPQLEFSCPESWNAMSPQEGGRYCGSCEKVVTDFSKMSNEEILRQMHLSNEVGACGSFKAYQLEAPFNDKRNLLIRFYQRISTSGKTILPKFISLGLVTALLFLSGCFRRTSGMYATPRRSMKKMYKNHMKQQDKKKIEKQKCKEEGRKYEKPEIRKARATF